MKKGLFWAIKDISGECKLFVHTVICDKNGVAEDGQPAYNSKKGSSYSHERTWPELTKNQAQKIKGKTWNHFPRGRVEIANGKATVYFNPELSGWTEFQATVIEAFGLNGFPVRFAPDYSNHYKSKGDF